MSLLDTASLIVTPNAYKEGKLYSVIPSDGSGDMSVVRATTATRVNSAGLVELVPYNLLTYSEQFDNAAWVKNLVAITANASTAPNGTTTADKIILNNGSQSNPIVYQVLDTTANTRTLSFFAKASEYNIAFGRVGGAVNAPIVLFSLTGSGSILHNQNVSTYSIESVGDGWYRCSMTYAHGASFAPNIGVCSATYTVGLSTVDTTGDGTSGIYIWGAQVNEGTIKDYLKTETRLNIPRLDYSNGTCPSLLVEPQRTNICRDSNNLSGGGWLNQTTNSTLTRIQSGGPDGNAFDRLVVGGALNSDQGRFVQFTTNVGSVAVYSVYLKGSGNAFIGMYNGASATPTTIALTNEWTRYEVIATGGSGTYIDWALFVLGQSTCDIAFHQVEFATYPTSYIPTTSASVTRNADVISKTGISSLIGQTEGTLFVDFYNDGNSIYNPFSISDGYFGQAIYFEQYLGEMYGVIWSGGSQQFIFNAGALSIGNHRMAIAYKTNDIAFYIDGVLKATDSSATIPTCSRIDVGHLAAATYYKAFINSAALWKTRLTNDELERLTGTGFNTYAEMANYYNYITQ